MTRKYKDFELTTRWKRGKPYLVEKGDDRYDDYMADIRGRGFDDSETWSLDCVLASFMLPRLKRFAEVASEAIILEDSFYEDLDALITALEIIDNQFDCDFVSPEAEEKKWLTVSNGLSKFPQVMSKLWW